MKSKILPAQIKILPLPGNKKIMTLPGNKTIIPPQILNRGTAPFRKFITPGNYQVSRINLPAGILTQVMLTSGLA